jgi:hypothetical protein
MNAKRGIVMVDEMSPGERESFLREHMELLRTYSVHKLMLGDWHGAMDAAADLRDCEQRLIGRRDG